MTWLEDQTKHLFKIVEQGKGINETWFMKCTNSEMLTRHKQLEAANGYIAGVGGDRTYSCVVVRID